MEADENHHKRSRVDDDGEKKGTHPWHHPSSRIFRVSRASGGKDRHSKVYTAKGLRDRRVRLSVSTAIQFYDLQDRLGYDQPSKAIEWLIKSAATAIAELPTLESSFPELPGHELVEHPHQQQHLSVSRSGCSSTSETSKGSVLSLSRSESRVKARERARERAAKEKEVDDVSALQHQSLNSDQGSFTELLTGSSSNGANCIQKGINYMPVTTTADYFAQARIFGQAQKAQRPPSSDFASQAHLGDTSHVGVLPFNIAAAAAAAGEHTEMRQFPFLQNHPVVPIAAIGPGDYTLNFSISPGHLHRGTLQSNSPSQLPHHHLPRLSPSVDGSNMPFFFGAASPATASATSAENQFTAGFDGRLQLCYGDEYRHSDLKGKGKS